MAGEYPQRQVFSSHEKHIRFARSQNAPEVTPGCRMTERDTMFGHESQQAGDFVFDDRVVRVFPDMIRRSVPGYGLIVPSLALIARRFVQPGSRIYDLGCSLGAVSLAIREAVTNSDNAIVAVDNSPDMIRRFRTHLAEVEAAEQSSKAIPVEAVEADILDIEFLDASVIVLNFTLQFIEPGKRSGLLSRIAHGMRPGGALLLSEKVRFQEEREQALQDRFHLDFKRAQGYSELEIARKREALENTLKPDFIEAHFARLRDAGFKETYTWFQCFNFVSMIAIR